LVDDFKILRVDPKECGCVSRDISDIKLFMRKSDKESFNDSPSSNSSDLRPQKRKLKDLAEEFLNASIQDGHHSSVIDARAALALYRMHYEEIETKFRCLQALEELQLKQANSSEEEKDADSINQLQYLMENKADIFNITPPNAKAEDKLKDSRRYKLF
jgi:hypothetical protein